jgi:DNA polymerase-3 subunit delta
MSLARSFEPQPAPVYLLVHESGPIRDGATVEVVEACTPHIGLAAFNHTVFRAEEAGIEAVQAARTLPMMADRRLVVVRNLEEGNDAFFAALLAYLGDPSPSTTLVLNGAKFPKVVKGGKRWSTSIKKAVESVGWVLNAKMSVDPVVFVLERAEALECRMSRRAASVLVEVVGRSLGTLAQEVAKLATYAADRREITEKDVAEVSSMVAEAVVFDLTTALVAKDANLTLAALQHLLEEGNDPRYILAMVTWKMRSIVLAADAMRQGASDGTVSKVSGLRSREFARVKPVLADGVAGPDVVLARLARANFDMNNHRAGDTRILERLVVDWLA